MLALRRALPGRLLLPLLPLLSLGACGDDDVSSRYDAGFTYRDAAFADPCVPYFLADRLSEDGGRDDRDASAPHDAGQCISNPGVISAQCETIDFVFGGGEHIQLVGCCSAGLCGAVDPTGVLGCMPRAILDNEPARACSVLDSSVMDASEDDAS